jgi:putative addiction module component (TIGR02574 family)
MSPLLRSLGLDQLTQAERLALVQELWDSIAADSPPPLTESQRTELERRIQADDSNPDATIPWEIVRARTASRLQQP